MTTAETAFAGRIVAQARLWVGTPYHDGGRLFGVGIDCGGLVVEVFRALGVPIGDDPGPAGGDRFEGGLKILADVCSLVTDQRGGDVLVYRGKGIAQHAAFDTGEGTVIHAMNTRWARKVVEQRPVGIWPSIEIGRYRLKDTYWPH